MNIALRRQSKINLFGSDMKNSVAQIGYNHTENYHSNKIIELSNHHNDLLNVKTKSRLGFIYFITLGISVLVLLLR
jgi:hypothetical protein